MVGHADAESRVGTRNNGHPLISYSLGRLVQPRLHDDDLATLSLGIVELIGGVATLVGHPVVAKVEVQLAILNGKRIGSSQHTAGHEHLRQRPGAERDGAHVVVHCAAHNIQQADNRIEIGISDVIITGTQNGARAVIVVSFLHLGGNVVERLIPAEALPFIFAAHSAVGIVGAPALTLHGVLDARRRGHVADLGAAARTGTALRHFDGILVLLVGADFQRHTIFHIHL